MVRAIARGAALAALVLATTLPALAATSPDVLSGALAGIARSGVVRIGYREDAAPFSFVSQAGEPAGYSIDLCRQLVEALRQATGGRPLRVELVRVDAADRLDRLVRGDIDLECGSTTNTTARRARVAFSPPIFVTGTKLAVPAGSRVRSIGQLAGRRAAVVMGTTNEAVLREVIARRRLAIEPITVPTLAAAFDRVAAGEADAVVGDDILLVGELARSGRRKAFAVVGDSLSFDRYAIAYTKDDDALTRVVDDAFRDLARAGELRRIYAKWFLRTLPNGVRLGLPMSAELTRTFEILGQPPD